MSCPKWLPKDIQNSYNLFNDLSRAAVTFKWLTNRYLSEINSNVSDLYVSYSLSSNRVNQSHFCTQAMSMFFRFVSIIEHCSLKSDS